MDNHKSESPGVTEGQTGQCENKPPSYKLQFDELTKRSLGKAIIKHCGHEGTEDTDNKAALRKLFQAVISHIPEEKESIWKNAQVKLYDEECVEYTLISGGGRHKFAVFIDRHGVPKVMREKQPSSGCVIA